MAHRVNKHTTPKFSNYSPNSTRSWSAQSRLRSRRTTSAWGVRPMGLTSTTWLSRSVSLAHLITLTCPRTIHAWWNHTTAIRRPSTTSARCQLQRREWRPAHWLLHSSMVRTVSDAPMHHSSISDLSYARCVPMVLFLIKIPICVFTKSITLMWTKTPRITAAECSLTIPAFRPAPRQLLSSMASNAWPVRCLLTLASKH